MNNRISYQVYGLHLVCDHPIPGLVPRDPDSMCPADIFVQSISDNAAIDGKYPRNESLWYVSDILDDDGNPAYKIWKGNRDGDFRIRYTCGVSFFVDAATKSISIQCPVVIPLEQVAMLLLGPVLGIVLRLRGVTCLHASGIAMGKHAIAFVGDAGAGKSTTAALFARQGHAVLSDDLVTLFERNNEFDVLPAYPYLNLWPESVEMVYGSAGDPGSVPPKWGKRQIRLDDCDSKFHHEAMPLRAIYLLADRSGAPDAPKVERVSPQDALIALVSNTYGNKLLDTQMRAEEFRVLGRILATLPIRRLIPGDSPDLISSLYQVVSDDFATLKFRIKEEHNLPPRSAPYI
ncbi:MAG: hypothetical protein WBE87_02220 [Candidatus Acidiferrales bacterium]